MTDVYSKAMASIEGNDDDDFGPNGGFVAVLSTPSLDRDGDRLMRDEWKEFTQERYPLDIDHGMSVAETVGSFVPYFDGDRLMMKAHFADNEMVPNAKIARSLTTPDPATGIRHVQNVSVAFMTDKTEKDSNAPFRELLNAGIVATPSNRDAVILASKAASALKDAFSDATEGEVPAEVKEAVLEVLGAETKEPKPYGDVHYADPEDGKYPIDTVAHIRAALAYINVQHNYDALGDHAAHVKRAIEAAARAHGIDVAGKSVDEAETKNAGITLDVYARLNQESVQQVLKEIGETIVKAATPGGGGDHALVQAIHDASSHLGANCIVVEPDVDPDSGASSGANKSADEVEVKDLESFEKALDEALKPEESPAVEEPAPAPVAAAASDDAADGKAKRMRGLQFLQMQAQLSHSK
jgi:hypothetical protein